MEQDLDGVLRAIGVLLGVAACIMVAGLLVLRRVFNASRVRVGASLAIAAVHTTIYSSLFWGAFAAGDAGETIPLAVQVPSFILGAPFMYLLYLPPTLFAPWGRWWGDDSNSIVGLTVLNGLLWGFVIVWLFDRWRSHHSESA